MGRTRSHALRTSVLAGALAATGLVVAGCGSGVSAETLKIRSHAVGAGAQAGDIAVRNAYVAPAQAGGSGGETVMVGAGTPSAGTAQGYLAVSIANSSTDSEDTLTGITVAGTSVDIGGDTRIGPHSIVSFGEPAGDTATGGGQASLPVSGLSQPLQVGRTVEVVFSFQRAGSLTLQVPVAVSTGTTATATPMPSITLETTTPSPEGEPTRPAG